MNQLPPKGDTHASKQRLQYCAKLGLLKHAIAEDKGGKGDGFIELINAHHAMGKSSLDCGLILSINAHLWGSVFPVLNYGNTEQHQQYLQPLLDAELIAGHAITEPQAGSDINAIETRAIPTADGFILSGHKRFITNTPIADLLIIYAKLDEKLTAFIVHKNDANALFKSRQTVDACQTATMGDVVLEKCYLPKSRMLGKKGSGGMMIQQALELERAFIFAGISGVMAKQLETVIEYSRQRKANGQHLGKNQAISHKIAEMRLRLDTLQLWLYQCAQLKDNKKRITLASAQTKLYAAEAFLQSSLDAVHILGASGLQQENGMTGLVNDAMASRLFSGSSEVQKNIIAALSGTGDGYI